MRTLVPHLLGCLTVCLSADIARADVFVLANGGRIEGELLNPEQSPRRDYQVKTRAGGLITLATDQVERVLHESEAERWYKRWLPEMPQTVEGNWIMAEECGKRGLDRQRKFHLEQVLEREPDHAKARYALGYSKVNDNWVRAEQWMADRGYVRQGGAWKLRQEIELDQEAQQREQEENEWRRQLKMWLGWVSRSRGREREALEKIRSIRSPHAAAALADVIGDAKTTTPMKLLCIDVLAKLRSGQATMAFVDRVLHDRDENVRDRCLDQLAEWDTDRAVAAFVSVLSQKDNAMINRAGEALGRLKDPQAILPLIDALTTKHRIQIPPGPGMSTSFSPTGGGGMTMGGRPKLIEVPKQNPGVRNALIAIASGVNFGYDKEKWKQWYAEQNTPKVVDLRRQP